jgi:pyruvate-ferredoxin/flavodoxin oxidoreductase
MWFKRSSPGKNETYPMAGMNHYLDGQTAAATAASQAGAVLLVRETAEFNHVRNRLQHPPAGGKQTFPDYLRQAEAPATLLNRAAGLAATGQRCTVLTDSLSGLRDALPAIAGRRLPLVVHLATRATNRQAQSRQGGHDEYHAVASAGWFQFFAASPQEVVDLGLIAQRLAEAALTPGLVAQDCFVTSHGIRLLQMPGAECIEAFLGRAEDLIPAPTPAQAMLFGDQRRRVPVLINLDAPAGLGLSQDQESFFAAAAAQRPFFAEHIEGLAAQAMQAYGELTGRFHAPLSGYRAEDAEYLVLAQGAITLELRGLVDRLRAEVGIKAGVVGLTMLRPFPGGKLAQILKGKKALTVLERIDQPLAEDLPLLAEVRSALDKAHENAKVQGTTRPYPDYAAYDRPVDRPTLYSGIYGLGVELPTTALLHAVFTNMTQPGGSQRFYLGNFFTTPDRRFPHLQATGQRILRDYPGIQQNSLAPVAVPVTSTSGTRTIRLLSDSAQRGLAAVNTLARGLAYIHNWKVSTFPDHGYDETLGEGAIAWQYSMDATLAGPGPDHCDILLACTPDRLNQSSAYASVAEKGVIIVQTEGAPQDLWNRFSPDLKEWIRKRQLSLKTIAPALRHHSAVTDDLTAWRLLGAGLEGVRELGAEGPGTLGEFIDNQLQVDHGQSAETASACLKALREAGNRLVTLNWQRLEDNREPIAEAASPWNLAVSGDTQGDLFNARRFWHSVGYLYRTGRMDQLPADPMLATGIVPAGSGAGRDLSAQHYRLPEWQPEKCTGCGACWGLCPESALPSALYTPQALVGQALKSLESEGKTLIQIKRIQEALGKQAYLIAQRDGLHQFTHLDQLLAEAFRQLLEKLSLDAKQQAALREEFKLLEGYFAGFRAARTETFFDGLHAKSKGNGALLAISLNPAACTACGLCAAVCPEQAFVWMKTSPERLSSLRQNFSLQMQLPETAPDLLEAVCEGGSENTACNRLLRKSAYLAMSGGDGSVPGNLAKSAAHNIVAAVESVMQPRFARHSEALGKLGKALMDAIQGKLTEAVKINDFDDFAHKLSRLGTGGLTTDRLVSLVSGDSATGPEHQARIQRMTALLEQISALRERYEIGAGRERARMILVLDPEAGNLWNGTYPYNPHANPWISLQPEETAGLAEGLYEGTCNTLIGELALCRSAAAELQEANFSAATQPIVTPLCMTELTPEERGLLPPVLILCRSRSLSHTGLSRLLSGAAPILVAMIEGDPLPLVPGSRTFHGGTQPGLHALLHADAFVVQASAADPGRLIQGCVAALEQNEPALFHVLAPEHAVNPAIADRTLANLKLAGKSRLFPAFTGRREQETASLHLTLHDQEATHADWAEDTIVYQTPAGTAGSLARRVTPADWALQTGSHPGHFQILGLGHLNAQMLPLTDYIELPPEQREGKETYILFADSTRQEKVAVVSAALVQAVCYARDRWRHLQGIAEPLPRVMATDSEAKPTETVAPPSTPDAGQSVQTLTENLLAMCGYSGDPVYFKRSLREFLGRGPGGSGDATG